MAKRGMPGNMGGNMGQMLKQAQKAQAEMEKAQKELEETIFETTAGGGAITLKIAGNREIKEIILKPEIVDPDDIEMLQDLIIAAVNEGMKKTETAINDRMGRITGNMNIPGLF